MSNILPEIELNSSNIHQYIKSTKENDVKVTLEIGFGSGENLFNMLTKNKKDYFVGCEPYLNGLASFISKLEKKLFNRIKVFQYDFRILLSMFPENFLDNILILFPDPWPKTRHKKRRIINNDNIDLLTNCLKKNGTIYTATDVENYFLKMLDAFNSCKKTTIINKSFYKKRPKIFSSTRYEQKAINKNKSPFYLIVKKN